MSSESRIEEIVGEFWNDVHEVDIDRAVRNLARALASVEAEREALAGDAG